MTLADTLTELANRGVTFEPLPGGKLKVHNVASLTDAERETLRAHRREIVEYLASAANDSPAPVTATTRAALAERYGPLVQIAATLDEAREVRLAELLACIDEPTAATLASDTDALIDLARGLVEAGRLRPVVYRRVVPGPSGVRCIDCRHHRRTDHPHLVDCAAGVEPTNPTRLWWDIDRRGCEAFELADPPRNDEPIIEGELLRDDDAVDPHDERVWRQRLDAEMAYNTAVPVNVPCTCGGNLALIDAPRPPMAAGKPELMRRADGRVAWSNTVDGDDIARQRAGLRYRCEACGTTIHHGQVGKGAEDATPSKQRDKS